MSIENISLIVNITDGSITLLTLAIGILSTAFIYTTNTRKAK